MNLRIVAQAPQLQEDHNIGEMTEWVPSRSQAMDRDTRVRPMQVRADSIHSLRVPVTITIRLPRKPPRMLRVESDQEVSPWQPITVAKNYEWQCEHL
jgi:hypothetical protein